MSDKVETKVSVIVPVYNVEKYLDECMDSLLNQTLEEIEIILVDDGSPDNSPKMCDDYAKKDKRVKVIHKKNAGLGMARNSGLKEVTGEYVIFIDSDDYVDKDMLRDMYETAKKNDADVCVCGHTTFKGEDEYTFDVKENALKDRVIEQPEVNEEVLLGMIGSKPEYYTDKVVGMGVTNKIYRVSIIKEHNMKFCSEREFISEDIIFQLTYFPKVKKVASVDKSYYYYRENLTSLTKKYNPERFKKAKSLYLEEVRRLREIKLEKEGTLRAQRMFLGNVRVALMQAVGCEQYKFKEKYDIVKKICKDDLLQSILSEYPYMKNPKRQSIYSLLIDKKLYFFVYILTYVYIKK